MNTAEDVLNVMRSWLGYSRANGKHKIIIDLYNSKKPLPRGYKLKYTDSYCDGTVSAAAMKAGMESLIGRECGVEEHVKIFKKMGIWIEDGTITPKPGDIIVFNWDDKTQPNDGFSDHIGYVEEVIDGMIHTLEGNVKGAVVRRAFPLGFGQIRGFARPKYSTNSKPQIKVPKVDLDSLARDVIAGKYGSGEDRKKALGSKYTAVQERVNEILAAKSNKVDIDKLAKEVIAGKYGSGDERKKALGVNYDAVQKRVNELLRR